MSTPDEDDWEYEYDPVLTETFFLPLDLSNLPRTQKHTDTGRRTGHPTLLKSRLRALNAQRGVGGTTTTTTHDDAEEEGGEGGGKQLGEVQIVNLHTENPLVVYNGQVLSVQWASTIGTDLFFARPDGTTPEIETEMETEMETEISPALGIQRGEEPLRRLPHVDLLGTSSAKLVARLGRLRPRDELFEGVVGEGRVEGEKESGDKEGAEDTSSTRPPSSFLARLNALKSKRGETRLAVEQSGDGTRLVTESVDVDVEMSGT